MMNCSPRVLGGRCMRLSNDCGVCCGVEEVLEDALGFVWKVIGIVYAVGVG